MQVQKNNQENTQEISTEEVNKQYKKNRFIDELKSFVFQVLVCLTIVALFVNFFFKPVQVNGTSMYPTLVDGEVGIVNIIDRKIEGLKRFDIVVIKLDDKYIIKRVIGLPGETVSYREGKLYINDKKMNETFLNTSYAKEYDGTFMEDIEPITLSDDEYYCLGDNRPNSADSRVYGPFHSSQIISRSLYVLYKRR